MPATRGLPTAPPVSAPGPISRRPISIRRSPRSRRSCAVLGGAPAVAAAIGNHVDVINVSLPTAQPQIDQGVLRGLGIPSPQRSSALPNVPTYGEAGFPNFHSATWVGFFVPAKTPNAVVEKLNTEINEVLKSPELQQKLKSIGFDPIIKTTAESMDYARNEVALWGKMSRAIGFTPQ